MALTEKEIADGQVAFMFYLGNKSQAEWETLKEEVKTQRSIIAQLENQIRRMGGTPFFEGKTNETRKDKS